MTESTSSSAAAWHLRLFKKSLTKQAKLRALERYVGSTEKKICLDVGGDNGIIPYLLRKNGGTWVSVDSRAAAVKSMSDLLGEEQVYAIDDTTLPFEDHAFDVIVVIDYLERIREDQEFIQECHRCLKTDGRIVLNTPHIKSWSISGGIKSILGQSDDVHGHVRPGYKLRDIYDIAKDGFDIVDSHTYGGFFVESLDAVVKALGGGKGNGDEAAQIERSARTHGLWYPLMKLAALLDGLFRFTCNHYLCVHARRRPWIERRGVRIGDGRSIAEATIGEKVGSAREF